MKKILLLFILFYPVIVFSQPASGDGSSGNPYSGVITTPWTLSGDKYCGSLSVSSGTFTIDPGAILRFNTGTSLTISGSGALSAVGNSTNLITFTASGSTWGHISFDNTSSTAVSAINYCIVEKGSVTGSGYAGAGGGILIRHSYVTVSNSTIKSNSSDWGGGIFVDANKNPYIYNCMFKDNTTIHGGGGIYFYNGAGSIVENCIFDNNHCTEPSVAYYTGGGVTAQISCAIKILNCTFVNNTSTRTEGYGILLHSSPNSRVINSIFWGSSDKQIYCYGTTSSIIINCAYRGITYSTGTPVNPVILSSTNDAADGPNFTNPSGSDWSIKFVSPCRDAGVNSYTGVTIPALDYIGNSRIGTKDIGTYEVQYSRWKTDASAPTSWTTAGNWEQGYYPGLAGTTGDVAIPYLADDTYAPNISGTTTIASGKYMVLEPGAKATFATLTNNGTLRLESDATNISSLIVTTHSGSAATIELNLTGGGSPNYKWHYISTPVSSLDVSTFTGVTDDIAQFIESRPSTDVMQGWVAYDGWIYASGTLGGPTFSTLSPGKGYNYYDAADQEFTFSGSLNTGNVAMTLGYSGTQSIHGYNLLGNPFSSGLDWDAITAGTYFTYPTNTSLGLYFTRNNAQCTYINGVGTPGDVTEIIPPMQGFFVKANGTPGSNLTLPIGARTHNSIHARYKGAKSTIPLVRLSITEDSISDEAVVRFDELAKTNYDNDFDALKMFISSTNTSIYSSTGGTEYAINGQPFPETFVEIPIVVNLIKDGIHSISAIQLQNLDNYEITLKDNSTGFTADLKTTPSVTFSASTGTITDRFILKVSNLTTGIEDPVTSLNVFNIFGGNNLINIQTIADEWDGKIGSARVLDLAGKTISDLQNNEFSKNSLTQVHAPGAKGMYVVEIRSGVKRYVGKVVIR